MSRRCRSKVCMQVGSRRVNVGAKGTALRSGAGKVELAAFSEELVVWTSSVRLTVLCPSLIDEADHFQCSRFDVRHTVPQSNFT